MNKKFEGKGSYTVCFFFFLYIRTSNFGAEAERSYIFFLRFEAENVLLKDVLKLHGIHYMYFSKSMRM